MKDHGQLVNEFGAGITRKIEECGHEPVCLSVDGSGENTIMLYRFPDGTEVIQTNGDPVWDSQDGFADLRLACSADK